MLKKLVILVVVVFSAYTVNAQAAFEKGDLGVNLGLNIGSENSSITPGLSASGEFGLFEIGNAGVISLGGNLDAIFYSSDIYVRPAFRAAFHLGFLNTEQFDVYAGVMSGFTFGFSSNYLFMDDFIGGRYMFKDNMGVFAEVGFISATNLRGGLCWIL